MKPYSIILADDHVIFRRGIRKIIQEVADFKVVGEAGDGLELLELLKDIRPDLIILDISMPHLRGLEATEEIKKQYPRVKVLLLTMHKKKSFVQLGLQAGADGFLLKEDADSELFRAIGIIRQGNIYLSPLLANIMRDLALLEPETEKLTRREREILKLLAEGKKSREIAALLYISLPTVRSHRYNIMRKLNLKSLVDMVKYAASHEFIFTE
ncbi:MAG: DNA-binding response regulator [Deltaproteobacteria bacterium]|nr:MAG: DNA-binding response regulator [Deltaproteobacteria bacterium]